MASSQKTSSSVPHKRAPEEPLITAEDLPNMLKKIKLESERERMTVEEFAEQIRKLHQKCRSDFAASQKQSHSQLKDKETAVEDCSRSLQSICFCDEDNGLMKGRNKQKSKCSIHWSRKRSGDSSRRKNVLSMTQFEQAHKSTVDESCFEPGSSLQSPSFSFVKLKEGKDESTPELGKGKEDSTPEQQGNHTKGVGPSIFTAATSKKSLTFASFSQADVGSECGQSRKDKTVFHFEGYRGGHENHFGGLDRHGRNVKSGGRDRHGLFFSPQNSETESDSSRSSTVFQNSEASAPLPVSRRVDFAVDRSCSQEARLEELEYSYCAVDDLAGYFENNFFIPKEMSAMASAIYS